MATLCQRCPMPMAKDPQGGMPRFLGWMFTRSLPRLERWRS